MVSVLAASADGQLRYQLLTPEYLEEVWEVLMAKTFFQHENMSKVLGLPDHPEAIAELKEPTLDAIRDGVSVIALEKDTNKLVGVSINALKVKNGPSGKSFSKCCKYPQSRGVFEIMVQADQLCNLYDLCQVDCILEIVFLSTLPETRGKGVGKKLCEVSIEVAKRLNRGENIKKSLDGKQPSLEPVPGAVSAIFTSFITQKIGRSLGFQVGGEKNYDEMEFQGRLYSDIVGEETKSYTVEYLKL